MALPKGRLLWVVAGLMVSGCSYAATVDDQVQALVRTYIDYATSHYYDIDWHARVGPDLFHPHFNGLGHADYVAVALPEPSFFGMNLFTKAVATDVVHGRDRADLEAPPDEEQDLIFVKIVYTVIAATQDGKVVVLKKPAVTFQYLVLTVDVADRKLKIIDFSPTVGTTFVGARYFFDHFDQFSVDGELRRKLAAVLGTK